MLQSSCSCSFRFLPYFSGYSAVPNDLEWTQKYDPSSGLVNEKLYKQMQNSERSKKYALAMNDKGDVVFKKPRSAFNAAKKDYKVGWKYVDKDLKEKHISKTYYLRYIEIAKTIDQDKNATKEQKEQLKALAEVLKIYENSYRARR